MAATKLKDEEERCLNYLKEETKEPLLNAVHDVMITRHSKTLMEMDTSGLAAMIGQGQLSSIKLMYDLFKRGTQTWKDFSVFLES